MVVVQLLPKYVHLRQLEVLRAAKMGLSRVFCKCVLNIFSLERLPEDHIGTPGYKAILLRHCSFFSIVWQAWRFTLELRAVKESAILI